VSHAGELTDSAGQQQRFKASATFSATSRWTPEKHPQIAS